MKLIKKLLIPGVALSVLFGFSFADQYVNCYKQGSKPSACKSYTGNIDNQDIQCQLYCSAGGSSFCSSYQQNCFYKITSIDLPIDYMFGLNKNFYYIQNSSFHGVFSAYVNGSKTYTNLLNGNSINNNKLSYSYTFNNLDCGIIDTGGLNLCNRYGCTSIIPSDRINYSSCPVLSYYLSVDTYTNNSDYYIYYKDLPAINQNSSGEYFIGGAVNNKIGQGTSQGFSNLLHFIIQFLPLMIFVFIIGYIIRKILIRFGMLKSPGVALNSNTYNKGKK